MTPEQFLSARLRRLSIVDFALIEMIYIALGLLLAKAYAPFASLGWGVYLTLSLVCALPVWMRILGYAGSIWEREKQFLKNNTPAYQVLVLIACVSFSLFASVLFPSLLAAPYWVYIALIGLLAVKPIRRAWF
ncbi:MAG: hypothetical protein PHX68_01720 [Alphaproteobacteria bacterium]|nr:hypothetical protein [Alphaproteobacteria bacterium]